MKTLLKIACLLIAATVSAGADTKTREQKIALTEDREVIVAVPDGFALVTGQDQDGAIGIKLSNPDESVTIDVTFLPDPESKFAPARGRTELLYERFAEYVDSSTEKGMQFEELEPRIGAGTFCVFTDVKLIGKTKFPPGEYLHLTAGVKSWRGVVAVFRCFSNDTTSAGYRAVMTMLRESVHERLVPLK